MVQGLSQLQQRWGRIPQRVRNAARAAMEQSAEEMVKEMRARVNRISGDLADSIGWTWGDEPAGSLVITSYAGGDRGSMVITIYAGSKEAYYAAFVEFGTVKNPARTFFYPTYRALRRRAKARLTRKINQALKGL